MLLMAASMYIGIINREKAYFYVAAVMLGVMLCLVAGLLVRAHGTKLCMHMAIPVVDKGRTFEPSISVSVKRGKAPYVTANFKIASSGIRSRCRGSYVHDGMSASCTGQMRLDVVGRYEIRATGVRIYDALHLFSVKRRVKDTAAVYVLPQCYPIPVEVSRRTRDFVTDSDVYYTDARGKNPDEVYQIRQYQSGDRLNSIHWKLTARQDELMVRETARSLPSPIVVCVNLNGRDCRKYAQAMSALLETVVSVSYSLIEVRVPHFVAWFDTEEMSVTRCRILKEEDVYDAAASLSYMDARRMGGYDVMGLYKEKYRGEDFAGFIEMDLTGAVSCPGGEFHVGFRTIKRDLENMYLTV